MTVSVETMAETRVQPAPLQTVIDRSMTVSDGSSKSVIDRSMTVSAVTMAETMVQPSPLESVIDRSMTDLEEYQRKC